MSLAKFMSREKVHNLKQRFSGDLLGNASKRNSTVFSDEEKRKVEVVSKRMLHLGLEVDEAKIQVLLRGAFTNGNVDRAVELLILEQDSKDGIVMPIDYSVRLQGAVNRQKTSCYLDSVLFAMFARLDAFEAVLYNMFEDEERKKLSALIRLFVNILRSGKLVTVDIVEEIVKSMSECGWKEAMRKEQQDASEAFTFITDKLNLPLLTLKMDLQHGGKEAVDDDHRFINERILSISLPTDKGETVHLADCLEDYFSDRVEVRRELERLERRNTAASIRSMESLKLGASFVETLDIGSNPSSAAGTPGENMPPHKPPVSLIREASTNAYSEKQRPRKGSTVKSVSQKEILVPAWCFFSILPFYTSSSAEDSTYAQHFSSKRPVLGLCLKRYSWGSDGKPVRNGVKVEIPLEIALPTFVSDDDLGENDGPLYGNFKLVLKSAVCHRGKSTNSGHYISLVREDPPDAPWPRWLLFDDLAADRVCEIDSTKAFADETPYLLFYQVEPIDSPSLSTTSTPSEEREGYFADTAFLNEKLRHSTSAISIHEGSIRLVPETGDASVQTSTAEGTGITTPGSLSDNPAEPASKRDSGILGSPWKMIRHARTQDDEMTGKQNGKVKARFARSKSRDKDSLARKSEEGAVSGADEEEESVAEENGREKEKGKHSGYLHHHRRKSKGERPRECVIQ